MSTPLLDEWYQNHAQVTKTQLLERLISDLRYQYPAWFATFSGCANDECSNRARGGALCPQCVTGALAELVGEARAAKYAATVGDCACARHALYAAISSEP
jgi:hypothetical protein